MNFCASGGGTSRRIREFPRSLSCTIPLWRICASWNHRICRSCGACLASAIRRFKCTGSKSSRRFKISVKGNARMKVGGQNHLARPRRPSSCWKRGARLLRLRKFARELCVLSSPSSSDLIERGDAEFQPNWLPAERYNQIAAACQQLGMDRLKPLKEALPPEIPYEEIRLVIARLRAN